MAHGQLRGFIARCESAATWRASLADRYGDEASLRAEQRLSGEATWAQSNPSDAATLLTRFRSLGLDFTQAWADAREYAFTTFCLEGDETREDWLTRVLHTED